MPKWLPGATRSCRETTKGSATSRAASYGFTLGGAVGLAMIEAGESHQQRLQSRWRVGGRHRWHSILHCCFTATHVRSKDGADQGVSLGPQYG